MRSIFSYKLRIMNYERGEFAWDNYSQREKPFNEKG